MMASSCKSKSIEFWIRNKSATEIWRKHSMIPAQNDRSLFAMRIPKANKGATKNLINLRGYRFTSGRQRDSGYRKKKGFHSANENRITDERVLVRQRNGASVCLSCERRYTGAGGATTTRGRRPFRGRLLDQAGCSL